MIMKVLMIGKYPEWSPKAWGGDFHTHKLAIYLVKRGHQVTFLNAEYRGEGKEDNVRYIKCDYTSYRGRPFYPKRTEFLKILDQDGYDIVHHFSTMGYPFERLRKNKIIQQPSVCSLFSARFAPAGVDSALGLLLKGKPFRYLAAKREAFCANQADSVTVSSNAMRDNIAGDYRIPQKKIHVIARGVDHRKFNPEVPPLKEISILGKHVILSTGRLEKEKGIQHLIKALSFIKKEIPATRLVIVGDGPDKTMFHNLAKKKGVEKEVLFLNRKPKEDMPSVYTASSVFALCSTFEPFGAVLIEAASCGRPSIAANRGGPKDIVVPGETGFLVEPENTKKLTKSLLEIISDPKKQQIMGRKARERVLKNYTWEHEAAQYEKLYQLQI
jgi:phosphatidylinositol alpha-1,6-mannosyltransferase